MVDTRRNLYQLLKGKQLYSTLHSVYKEVQHNLTAVLKNNAPKGETAKPQLLSTPSSKEFRQQRRQKRKPTDDADKSKEAYNIYHGSQRLLIAVKALYSHSELLCPTEVGGSPQRQYRGHHEVSVTLVAWQVGCLQLC
jgi:hypothetical protein